MWVCVCAWLGNQGESHGRFETHTCRFRSEPHSERPDVKDDIVIPVELVPGHQVASNRLSRKNRDVFKDRGGYKHKKTFSKRTGGQLLVVHLVIIGGYKPRVTWLVFLVQTVGRVSDLCGADVRSRLSYRRP